MSVFAIDGSKDTLPATQEIRQEFDPDSGLQYPGKGHYPQCLVSTVYDVFRRLPIARNVVPVDSCERKQVEELLPFIPAGSVTIFDRGYPSYGLICYLLAQYSGYFLFRCPAKATFGAVLAFMKSGKREAMIRISPTGKYLSKIAPEDRKKLKPIRLRVIRLVSDDGTVSVLLTNLYNKKEFPRDEIIDLYFKRWEVESFYRDEKIVMEVETFHSKTCNGVLQELFATTIMTVISRTLMQVSSEVFHERFREPQFKNAIMTLASEAAILAPDDPEQSVEIFQAILEEIYRVRYYRPTRPRPSQPRVTKRSNNKWLIGKAKKTVNA